MAREMLETSDAFAETASKLLAEYTARLVAQKQEATKIADRFHESRGSKIMDTHYLRERFENEKRQFFRSREVYDMLVRKASQWIEHGTTPRPHLEMELSVRLADIENMLRYMDEFYNSTYL